MAEQTLTARYLFPVDQAPLRSGTITLAGERIASVDPAGTRTAENDLGNVAIIPGLVNAHTHLDLTDMRDLHPPSSDFTSWLRTVVSHRLGRTPEQIEADVRAGLAECQRYGTTLIGDIASAGLSWQAVSETPTWAVVFYEMLGLPVHRAESTYWQAIDWLDAHPAIATCRPGLSPHSPYSVRQDLILRVAEKVRECASRGTSLPAAIHLAESLDELELLEKHTGPFVEFLAERGAWDPTGLAASPQRVLEMFDQLDGVLYAHGNYLRPEQVTKGTVVYCPRTHAAFGHAVHPFRELLQRGVRVALGTDSLASNPDLDVLAEARFLHRLRPDVPGDAVLRMATLSGAEALGWHQVTGSLTPGKSADIAVVALPDEDWSDPYELLLSSDLAVTSSMWRGQWRKSA